MKTRPRVGAFGLGALILLTGCARAPAPPPDEAPPAPVRLEVARRTTFQPELTLLGVVKPGGMAEVAVPLAGRLSYPGRFPGGLATGVEVKKGEVIARVSLGDVDADLAEARLKVQGAESEVARHRRAFEAGVEPAVTLADYQAELDLARGRLAAAENRLVRLALAAPLSGRLVVSQPIAPGSEVAAGSVLARVAADGALRVEGRAAAADRDRLHPGLAVRFSSGSGKEETGSGHVLEVAPVVDAGGTVALVIGVDDPTGVPAPGEGVEIRVLLDRHDQALTVPEEALVVAEGGGALFVAERSRGGLVAHRQAIEAGARGGGRVEILRGLSPGDRVVVAGAALLAEGDPLAAVAAPESSPEGPESTEGPKDAEGAAKEPAP